MKSVKRDKLIKFCRDYLKVIEFQDYCVNGLQVEGKEDVSKIVTGVSWSMQLVQHAIEVEAEMVLVHHGLFGDMFGTPPNLTVSGFMKKRLAQLLRHNINLAGFHLPLDAHPQIGNNASLCKLLGVKKLKKCSVGFVGKLDKPQTLKAFVSSVDKKLSVKSAIVAKGSAKVSNVAIISGGSSSCFLETVEGGADTFLCGDAKEKVVRAAEELGLNVINAGHYNTEKLGIINLGKLLAKRFGISVEFFDVPCEF